MASCRSGRPPASPRADAAAEGCSVVLVSGPLLDTAMFGGLLPSGLLVIFGLDLALAALLAIDQWAGVAWFGVFLLSVVYALEIPHWVKPIYTLSDPTGNAAINLIATGIVTAAGVIYFVHQRDRFQRRSDDLLHAILPDQIAARLKDRPGTIANDVASASVLFADVVGFTPMSAAMSPGELVRLLDELFTIFDGLVTELGLEKIKTVGDAYMVAAGVPEARPDHARAIAELALISPSSYELVKEEYVCEPRGPIEVKGKDPMRTYLLISRRDASG